MLAQKSKSLEVVDCYAANGHPMEEDLLPVLNLNKAGHRGLEVMSRGRPPIIKLWPWILERCVTVKYIKNIRVDYAEAELHDQIARDNLFLHLRDHANVFNAIQQVSVRRKRELYY